MRPLRKKARPTLIELPDFVYQQANTYAQNAMIGGRSHIRATQDRILKLHEDQLTGQLCHAAVSELLFDSFDPWREQREAADKNPTVGDDGTDFAGWTIDVKGSKMRGSTDPRQYHLIVRPAELKPTTWYIHALVQRDNPQAVWVTGIASGTTIQSGSVATSGPFTGAYAIPVPCLSAIELVWTQQPAEVR